MKNTNYSTIETTKEIIEHINNLDLLVYRNYEILSNEAIDQIGTDISYLCDDLEEVMEDFFEEYFDKMYNISSTADCIDTVKINFITEYFGTVNFVLANVEAMEALLDAIDYSMNIATHNNTITEYNVYI
jgi:hypothetical protein